MRDSVARVYPFWTQDVPLSRWVMLQVEIALYLVCMDYVVFKFRFTSSGSFGNRHVDKSQECRSSSDLTTDRMCLPLDTVVEGFFLSELCLSAVKYNTWCVTHRVKSCPHPEQWQNFFISSKKNTIHLDPLSK